MKKSCRLLIKWLLLLFVLLIGLVFFDVHPPSNFSGYGHAKSHLYPFYLT